MVKRYLKFIFILAVVFSIWLPLNVVQASSTEDIIFDNTITREITEGEEYDIYRITLSKAGKISVQLDSFVNYVRAQLTNERGDEIKTEIGSYISGAVQDPGKWTTNKDLEAGIYYFKIFNIGYTGKYKIKVNYTVANNNDIEPNDGKVTAQKLTLNGNAVSGYITWNDSADTYKIQLPKAGRIKLELNSSISSYILAEITNEAGDEIASTYINANEQDPYLWSPVLDLETGTYYVKVYNEGYTGKYSIKVNYTQANTDDLEPNNGTVTAQSIFLNGKNTSGFISWNDSEDVYKLNLIKPTLVELELLSFVQCLDIKLTDSYGKEIDYQYSSGGSVDEPDYWVSYGHYLSSGTYYIRVRRDYSGYTGLYLIRVNSLNGWVQSIFGTWDYYNANTGQYEYKTGWAKINSNYYYIKEDGGFTTGWKKIGKIWYYFNNDGVMLTGMQSIGGKWYYFYSSGEMAANTTVNGYKFDKNGALVTPSQGWFKINKNWHYYEGGKEKKGWQYIGKKWYYLDTSGVMRTGWQRIDKKWYYLDADGSMKTGWLYLGKKWYYLDASGVMKIGWQQINRKWYYLDANGDMKTGWLYLGNKWYYLDSNGAMKTGTVKIDSKYYNFDKNGVWI